MKSSPIAFLSSTTHFLAITVSLHIYLYIQYYYPYLVFLSPPFAHLPSQQPSLVMQKSTIMDRAHVRRLFSGFPFLVGILVMSSIFVARMKTHGLPVSREVAIAEGFAIVGVVWSIVGVPCAHFGTCITIPVEALMTGGYIFIAIVYKAGIGHCTGYADTPFGEVSGADGLPSIRDSCGMQTAIFALSVIVA
jgi:hypothetical protein